MPNKALVGIVMGSDSDWATVQKAAAVLKEFDVGFEVKVMSAHRTPALACEYATTAEARGLRVIIAAAGLAAHLGGVIAAHTVLPVIGLPVGGGPLNGQDALYATVQMPPGFPVATVALDKAGARNAAWLAAQILALGDAGLAARLQAAREEFKAEVALAGAELAKRHGAVL